MFICVAPLNWGLGHASRCVPLIEGLKRLGHKLILVADGQALEFLTRRYPQEVVHRLPDHRIVYPSEGDSFFLKIGSQLPQIVSNYFRENRALRKLHRKYGFDAIISDNRYGCYVPNRFNVCVTHQLRPKVGSNRPIARRLETTVSQLGNLLLRRFDQVWIPDKFGLEGLAGDLCRGKGFPPHALFVGLLSRFPLSVSSPNSTATPIDLLVILSGPEPQRTLLEERLLTSLSSFLGVCVFVRGRPGQVRGQVSSKRGNGHLRGPQKLTLFDHLDDQEMEKHIRNARCVLCRGGYSTLMDLQQLASRRLILIPTPGQTEQEYLARLQELKGEASVIPQSQITKSRLDRVLRSLERAGKAPNDGHGIESREGSPLRQWLGSHSQFGNSERSE